MPLYILPIKTARWIGGNDTGATEQDPSGNGVQDNDMLLLTESFYDRGQADGDGLLTKSIQHVDASETRTTEYHYDWRHRQIAVDGEQSQYTVTNYNNLDRILRTDRLDTDASGRLLARTENVYDERGRIYQTIRYAVDPIAVF